MILCLHKTIHFPTAYTKGMYGYIWDMLKSVPKWAFLCQDTEAPEWQASF